jgi:hypothetical protein
LFQRINTRLRAGGNAGGIAFDFRAGALDPRITFTRASAGWFFNSAGNLAQAATDAPRFDYDPATLQARGLLIEGASTNIALHSRDFTQTAWVKTNITAALNVTGIDGVANSASRLTATAGNGTALQTITSASATHVSSFFARRITGTGTVEITQDNGSTWTAITLTAAWQRFNVAAATVANPVIGFRLVTNGDVVAVDLAQCEVASAPTSPIITGAASVARAADNAAVTTLTPWFNATEGTILAEYSRPFPTANTYELSFNDGSSLNVMDLFNTGVNNRAVRVNVGGVSQFAPILAVGPDAAFQVSKKILAYRAADFATCLNGGTVSTGATGTIPTVTNLRIGRLLSVNHINGWIRRIAYYPTRLPNATLQGLTA